MNAEKVIRLARMHLGKGYMESSARLCLSDAIERFDAGDYSRAKARAIKSLCYSIGKDAPDYRRATK